MKEKTEPGISGAMSELYDVFVDWSGRLGRELPGLLQRLRAVEAQRVLDVGCGTGRHVEALLEQGFNAHGADASNDMLAQARELGLGEERLHEWCLGTEPPASVRALAPFDAITCLGNVWPHLVEPAELEATGRSLLDLLRPGGVLITGLKAFAVRRESGDPYLPLLKREHEERALYFLRFVDFEVEQPTGVGAFGVCDLHVSIVAGEARESREPEALIHRATRMRAWDAEELEEWFQTHGFTEVTVSGHLDDPSSPPRTEDVFVGARKPG